MAKVKHTKEYINQKISNCQRLVDESKLDAQREIYQGYLDFWSEKLPKAQRPEVIAKTEKDAEIAAEIAEVIEQEKIAQEEREAVAAEMEAQLEEANAKKVAELKAQLKALQGEQLEPEHEELFSLDELDEINFEKEFPNKKAYRNQNGERIPTIAFKEYINQKDTE